jgi:glycosyltransferase involved in cell wall biosynthesis
MTCAWLYVTLRDRIAHDQLQRRALLALGLLVPVLALVFYASGREAVTDVNPFAGLFARQPLALSIVYPLALAAAMIAFALTADRIQRPLTNAPVRALADISYGVYLIHFAVIWFAVNELSLPTGSAGAAAVWAAIVYPTAIGYAYVSARFLERPVRSWAHRYRDRDRARRRAAPTPAAPAGVTVPVTIVIPTHNRAQWLGGAIESALGQDYADLEVLVVDDGSTDATAELLEHYSRRHPGERFRFVRQPNAGQAQAINRGNELARGEVLGYLSDDDFVAPGLVSRLASELVRDPEAAVAYPAYHVINESGGIEDTVLPIPYSPLEALRLHDTVIGPGGLARRWAIEAAGGWDPALRWMGDLVLWLGVGSAGAAIRVPEPLASWRHHAGSVTLRLSLEHAREHLAVAQLGMGLAGLAPLSVADRAEALRNACLTAALFAGEAGTWPGDRYVTFDLHRKRISAWASGQPKLSRIDGDAAERAAERYRELVLAAIEQAEGSAPAPRLDGEPAGYEAAIRKLRAIGALAEADGSFAEGVDERTLRRGLVEAAIACGAELDLRSSRFAILDRRRTPVAEEDLAELVGLGYQATAEQVAEAIKRRRSPSSGPRGATSAWR